MVWFWGAATLFSLMAAWGRFSFLYGLLFQLPGVSSIRNPIKFMHPFVIAWVILAGFGLEAFYRCYMRNPAKPATARKLLQPPAGGANSPPSTKAWLLGLLALVGIGIFVAFQNYAGSKTELAEYIASVRPAVSPMIPRRELPPFRLMKPAGLSFGSRSPPPSLLSAGADLGRGAGPGCPGRRCAAS